MSAKNKLVITLPSDREIQMTRDFDAPRALVWEMAPGVSIMRSP